MSGSVLYSIHTKFIKGKIFVKSILLVLHIVSVAGIGFNKTNTFVGGAVFESNLVFCD